jgi:hypothetical protein
LPVRQQNRRWLTNLANIEQYSTSACVTPTTLSVESSTNVTNCHKAVDDFVAEWIESIPVRTAHLPAALVRVASQAAHVLPITHPDNA